MAAAALTSSAVPIPLFSKKSEATVAAIRSLSPPPAYALKPKMEVRSLAPAEVELSERQPQPLNGVPLTTFLDSSDDSDCESLSAINLSINTSVLVSNDNNIVYLDDPASNANRIAMAVVNALRDGSCGKSGIPMIDEDGRPRPLRIQVQAGLTVEGAGNVVGSDVAAVSASRRRGWESDAESEDERLSGASSPAFKRRCSD
ncbi:hypothetical protein GQ602_000235 [Ophiocordyceps camponoti-floridani]|uniref:Uncharacterized protein n=1 Tax=Ophiocordyceps camponoti-floridani TaxID=2030778 RepID=A0A8H4QBV6_9HYPO|nr:hypothetical protein GQ602_000235 [Ophiocordyceps camponoti-floridani]